MGVFADHQPSVVEVETTTYCNRRCTYCPNSIFDRGMRANETRMDVALWEQICDDLGRNDFVGQFSPLRYGEPLADERLPDLLAYARQAMPRARIAVYSNGDFLTPHLWERMEPSIDQMVITQHGDTMPAGLRALLPHPLIRYRIRAVIEARASNRAGTLTHIPAVLRRSCGVVMTEMHVDAHGDLMLCCEDYLGTRTFGTIRGRTLDEIWSDPDRLAVHRDNIAGRLALPACKGCGYLGRIHAEAVAGDTEPGTRTGKAGR